MSLPFEEGPLSDITLAELPRGVSEAIPRSNHDENLKFLVVSILVFLLIFSWYDTLSVFWNETFNPNDFSSQSPIFNTPEVKNFSLPNNTGNIKDEKYRRTKTRLSFALFISLVVVVVLIIYLNSRQREAKKI